MRREVLAAEVVGLPPSSPINGPLQELLAGHVLLYVAAPDGGPPNDWCSEFAAVARKPV